MGRRQSRRGCSEANTVAGEGWAPGIQASSREGADQAALGPAGFAQPQRRRRHRRGPLEGGSDRAHEGPDGRGPGASGRFVAVSIDGGPACGAHTDTGRPFFLQRQVDRSTAARKPLAGCTDARADGRGYGERRIEDLLRSDTANPSRSARRRHQQSTAVQESFCFLSRNNNKNVRTRRRPRPPRRGLVVPAAYATPPARRAADNIYHR